MFWYDFLSLPCVEFHRTNQVLFPLIEYQSLGKCFLTSCLGLPMVQRRLSIEFRATFVSLYHITLSVFFPAVFSFILAHSPVCSFFSCIQWSTWSFLLTSTSLWDQTSCTFASLNGNFIAFLFTWSVIIHHFKFHFRVHERFCEHLKSLVLFSM